MALASIRVLTPKEFTRASGSTISSTARARSSGWTASCTSASTLMAKSKEWANLYFQTVPSLKALSLKTWFRDTGSITTPTVGYIKETGKTIKWVGGVISYGATDIPIKETLKTIWDKVTASIRGTECVIKAIGKRESSMEKVKLYFQTTLS